jgi:primosomal protein N'
MFLVRVIPITKAIFKSDLSFFSRERVDSGSVVMAPLRGKNTPSLVIECTDAREEKLNLRSASFALKKINAKARPRRIFTDAFIDSCRDIALWHGVHEGPVLSTLLSHTILMGGPAIEEIPNAVEAKSASAPGKSLRRDLLMLQAEREERVRTYRNLAREAFARGASILVLAPTIIEAEILAENLERGIKESVILFHSDIPKKKLIRSWNRAITDSEPLLIIGTAFALSIPRKNIDTIVVERESARSYRGISRPHIDIRRAAETVSHHTGARLILADFPVRVETRYRTETEEMSELSRPQMRLNSSAEVRIMDVRKKDEIKSKKRLFRTVSEESTDVILEEIKRGGRVAVFAARRGIAPLTVCRDCGTPVVDPVTGMPMVLHKSAKGNIFMSHRSGAVLPAGTPCTTCDGWDLVTLGIGVDRVADELASEFKGIPMTVFTKDTAPSHKDAEKMAEQFFHEKGGIVVGTERMLPYLKEPVELVVVASVDSILSIPAWRAHEHALSILFYLRERAETFFIVETRKPDSEVMKAALSGNPLDFYRADIIERERYGYPPFAVFVGLSWQGTPGSVEKNHLLIENAFKDTDLVGPLPSVHVSKNMWRQRAVIRLAPDEWPSESLAERLRALPPDIEVTVDPDEIV